MNSPIDIPTAHTADFVASQVPRGGSILEIGCGAGHVAANLAARGYDVEGIDSDEASIAEARNLGVDAMTASWPGIVAELGVVNAVVFTRSLHHISPLSEAIANIPEVLLPGGVLLVEDFSFDEVDAAAIRWLRKVVGSGVAQELISADADEFVVKLLSADDPLDAWQRDHDHGLHTVATMSQEIGKHFVIHGTSRVPYLYRYLVNVLPETPEAGSLVRKFFAEESRLAEEGLFTPVGQRIVAAVR